MMRPAARKVALAVHVAVSVGLSGAVAAFPALAIAGLQGADAGVYVAADVVAWAVVVPLAFAALASGVASSLGTPWGLVRYYWVVTKLGLTVVAIIVLLLQLPTIATLAMLAGAGRVAGGAFLEARMALVVHSAGGLVVLVLPLVLSVWKPEGMLPAWRGWLGRRRA